MGCPRCGGERGEEEMGRELDSRAGRVCFGDGEGPDPAVPWCWLCPTEAGNCLWERKPNHHAKCEELLLSPEHSDCTPSAWGQFSPRGDCVPVCQALHGD